MSGADADSPASLLPGSLASKRLLLRPPGPADAVAINEGVRESFDALHRWMEWAVSPPSLEQTRAFCDDAARQRAAGTSCTMLIVDASGGELVGASGYARIDWKVPAFEIGYWCRTPLCGRGYVTEAVEVLTRHAFELLGARRVEIRMDDRNVRSAAVAERLGFELEGVLRHHVRDHLGNLRDTRVYSLVDVGRLAPPRVGQAPNGA
jgi:RimJ/RimL family protein N-acetyltransferase